MLPTLMITGCGGDSDDSGDSGDSGAQVSPAEDWASDVCTAVGTWKDAVDEASKKLSDSEDLSADEIRSAVTSVDDATQTLVSDLEGIGAPDTEAGAEAQQQVTDLSNKLSAHATVIEDAVNGGSDSAGSLLASISAVTGALSTMLSDTETAVDSIKKLDGADELNDAFENAESCQNL
jgi:hypothetical protein